MLKRDKVEAKFERNGGEFLIKLFSDQSLDSVAAARIRIRLQHKTSKLLKKRQKEI